MPGGWFRVARCNNGMGMAIMATKTSCTPVWWCINVNVYIYIYICMYIYKYVYIYIWYLYTRVYRQYIIYIWHVCMHIICHCEGVGTNRNLIPAFHDPAIQWSHPTDSKKVPNILCISPTKHGFWGVFIAKGKGLRATDDCCSIVYWFAIKQLVRWCWNLKHCYMQWCLQLYTLSGFPAPFPPFDIFNRIW